MDPRLYEASRSGDVPTFRGLLKEDPSLLVGITRDALPQTPLHIATLHGHDDLVCEILKLKQDLSQIPDKNGSYPIHLASAKGRANIVCTMLNSDPSLCRLLDKYGRTPIHVAAENDRVEVLKEFASKYADFSRQVTELGGTVLHSCVRFNSFEAAKFLVDNFKELVNMKDDRGNTVLHLATAQKQVQMLNLFLTSTNIAVNAVNNDGFTALDVLLQCPSETRDTEISKILLTFGGNISREPCSPQENKPQGWKKWLPIYWDPWMKKDKDWLKEMHEGILIAATIIATVTFQAGINPPGGFEQRPSEAPSSLSSPFPSSDSIAAGKALLHEIGDDNFELFLSFDIIGLAASLSIILLIISGLPLKYRFTTLLLVVAMWVAVFCMGMTFYYGTQSIIDWHVAQLALAYAMICWFGLVIVILLWRFLFLGSRFLKWLKWVLKKKSNHTNTGGAMEP